MKSAGERLVDGDEGGIEQAVLEFRHRFAYELVRAASSAGAEVLEVGFGQGHGPTALVGCFGAYEGLEVDAEALEYAAAGELPEHVSFRLYDGVQIPFRDNSFDIVFALQVIEHVHPIGPWLSERGRVCRSGGTILFTTPNRTHRVMDGESPWNRFHMIEWSPEEFVDLLEKHFCRSGEFEGTAAEVSVTGISAAQEIHDVELHRVRRMRKLARLDPLRLRERLPAGWVHRMSSALGRWSGRFLGSCRPSGHPVTRRFWSDQAYHREIKGNLDGIRTYATTGARA